MKILRVINNNVVSCTDDTGQELIAMGRGLGFSAKAGATLDQKRVEKIFRMENEKETERFKSLLASLPPEQIDLCARIISYATETLGKELNENVYLTLTDHVSFAISRMKKGLSFQNALLTEVRLFYPREFGVGRHALELITQELGVTLPEDEAASIALHLVNAEYDNSLSETMHITQALHDILGLLHSWPGLCPQEDSLYYDELTVNLKFLVLSAFSGEEETRKEPEFVRTIRGNYPSEYGCAETIAGYLEKQIGYHISEEKKAYLAIHIHRVNQNTTIEEGT